jgi:uncharacterized lipoprotein
MRILVVLATFLLGITGCSDARYLGPFELDERSFDADALAMVQQDTGIVLPKGSRGLHFRYKPPVDPAFIAKLEIPASAREEMIHKIEAIKKQDIGRRADSLWAGVSWWPPPVAGAIAETRGLRDGNDVWLVLSEENERLVLSIEFVVW